MYCFCLLQTLGGAKKMVVPKGLYIYGGVGKRLIQNRQDTTLQDNFMNPLQKLHGLPEMYMKHYTSQQHMFSFIGITFHSQKQLPLIHSQTRLHFIPALSSPHPHLYSHCVMCLSACLLVVCPNGYWNDMYIYIYVISGIGKRLKGHQYVMVE